MSSSYVCIISSTCSSVGGAAGTMLFNRSRHRALCYGGKYSPTFRLHLYTTGMIDLDYPVNIGGVEYITMEVSMQPQFVATVVTK